MKMPEKKMTKREIKEQLRKLDLRYHHISYRELYIELDKIQFELFGNKRPRAILGWIS